MCIICIDLDNKKLSPWEASRNRREMLKEFDETHLKVLDQKIEEAIYKYLQNLGDKDEKE